MKASNSSAMVHDHELSFVFLYFYSVLFILSENCSKVSAQNITVLLKLVKTTIACSCLRVNSLYEKSVIGPLHRRLLLFQEPRPRENIDRSLCDHRLERLRLLLIILR